MNPIRSFKRATVLCLIAALCAQAQAERAPIYTTGADARADIASAVARAKASNKHVLIQWGANWCIWCHLLHEFFAENAEAKALLTEGYEVVLVDTDTNQALLEEMKVKPEGIPYLTVLDGDGKKLVDQETGALESGSRHDPEKVNAFLKQWQSAEGKTAAPSGTADEQIAAALETAKRDGKSVLVTVGASWCGWCKKLEELQVNEKVGPILRKYFVTVALDQEKVEGTKAFRGANALDRSAGIPWYAALDASGKVVATSDAKADGNTGYPAKPEEIAWFMEVLKRAAPGMDQESLATVEAELNRIGAALLQK